MMELKIKNEAEAAKIEAEKKQMNTIGGCGAKAATSSYKRDKGETAWLSIY